MYPVHPGPRIAVPVPIFRPLDDPTVAVAESSDRKRIEFQYRYSTLDGMSATRIAQDLWFHALVYYIGSPIKDVLSRYGISWSKLNSWITSASYMEINSNDDRAWAFAIAWFAASGIQRTLWGTSSTSVLCYIVI